MTFVLFFTELFQVGQKTHTTFCGKVDQEPKSESLAWFIIHMNKNRISFLVAVGHTFIQREISTRTCHCFFKTFMNHIGCGRNFPSREVFWISLLLDIFRFICSQVLSNVIVSFKREMGFNLGCLFCEREKLLLLIVIINSIQSHESHQS